jgi:hypothetical protein
MALRTYKEQEAALNTDTDYIKVYNFSLKLFRKS